MDYDVLYEKYKAEFVDEYAKAKAAVEDGFDIGDMQTASEIAQELLKVINELQEDLTLEEKKEFLVHVAMQIYYEQKLPWYMKLSFVKRIIKNKITILVDKALDYLHDKGIVNKSIL